MAMFIVKPWYRKKNPDDYFDPVTHIATEENFIKFLERGVYDSKYIGYKVQLSNSVDYNNGLWVIADVNHDSINTGQSNCYDLISENIFNKRTFSSSSNIWRDSGIRTWLNNTFYPGFSTSFKARMVNMVYASNGNTYNDDKMILPSFTEVNGNFPIDYSSDVAVEGTVYPILTNNDNRKKYATGTTTYNTWWTRSRRISNSTRLWFVATAGDIGSYNYDYSYYLGPLMRVH